MQTLYNNQNREDLKLVEDSTSKIASTDNSENLFKTAWSYPVGKVVIISAGAVALLFAAGGAFRLLAWAIKGYNDFDEARNGK